MDKKQVFESLIEYMFDDVYSTFERRVELHDEIDDTLEIFVSKDEVVEKIRNFFRKMKEDKAL